MPMLLLFIGVLGSFLLFEIEGCQESGRAITLSELIRFSRVRKSIPMLILIIITIILASLEIHMYFTGRIYKSGIDPSGFIRLFIMFLAFGILMRAKIKSNHPTQKISTSAIATLSVLALIFVLTYFGEF